MMTPSGIHHKPKLLLGTVFMLEVLGCMRKFCDGSQWDPSQKKSRWYLPTSLRLKVRSPSFCDGSQWDRSQNKLDPSINFGKASHRTER